MARKRTTARSQRRAEQRTQDKQSRQLVRDREKLAALQPGGSEARPIDVPAASVIELRVESLPCPQCEGELRIEGHRAVDGLRALDVRCRQCGVARIVWIRIHTDAPN